jgi:hypothetical protein
MTVNKKIIAAVTAAIGEFLAGEQIVSVPIVEERRPEQRPGPFFSPWSLSGRQSMMEMRRFLQMRLGR